MGRDRNSLRGFKIFLLLFLALSLFFLKEDNEKKIMAFIDSFVEREKVLKLKHAIKDIDGMESVNFFDGNIIKWGNNKISCLNSDGSLILEKKFDFFDPAIYFGDKYAYVFDRATGDIYLFDSRGNTVDRLQLNKEIFNIKESGENLIFHIKSPEMEIINILDKDKVLIGNYIYEDKNILTYHTNEVGNKNLVALLNLNEGVLKSQLDIYGINNERLRTLDFEGEIALYLDFTQAEEIILLTDRYLYFINNEMIMWKKQFDLIKDIYLEKDKIYVLYSNYLETIDFSGRTQDKHRLIEEYEKILSFGDKILLYGKSHLLIIKDGKEILKFTENIEKVFTSKDEILVLGQEDMKIYQLSNK